MTIMILDFGILNLNKLKVAMGSSMTGMTKLKRRIEIFYRKK